MQHSAVTHVVRSIGGASASLLMWLVCDAAHYELALVPFTTSIIMVFGSPDSPVARPRSLIGGHILSSVVTLIAVSAFGYAPWVSVMAVGVAMCLMMMTRTYHAPAGMSIFVIVTMHAGWNYLLAPVAVGSIGLAAYASLYFAIWRLILGAFRRGLARIGPKLQSSILDDWRSSSTRVRCRKG